MPSHSQLNKGFNDKEVSVATPEYISLSKSSLCYRYRGEDYTTNIKNTGWFPAPNYFLKTLPIRILSSINKSIFLIFLWR